MILRKITRTDPFARVDKEMLADARLSWKAKGIMAYLLGQPDNWDLQVTNLVNHSTNGTEAIYSALKELRKFGYLRLVHPRGEGGLVNGSYWEIHECPLSSVEAETRRTRVSVKADHNKNDKTTKKDSRPEGASASLGVKEGEYSKTPAGQLAKSFNDFVIKQRLHLGKPKPSRHKWTQACQALLDRVGDHVLVERVMDWYFSHWRDEWVPTYHAVTTFCQNFDRLEKAMRRDQKESAPKGKSRRVKTVTDSGKTVWVTEWID